MVLNESGEFQDYDNDFFPLSQLSDCVTNAVLVLEKLERQGRIIWVKSKNHAYVVPNAGRGSDFAINLPTRVEIGGDVGFVKFEDLTNEQLLSMLDSDEAEDITG